MADKKKTVVAKFNVEFEIAEGEGLRETLTKVETLKQEAAKLGNTTGSLKVGGRVYPL
jgi:hypothetical protein